MTWPETPLILDLIPVNGGDGVIHDITGTTVYVVAVICVIPVAGLVAWVVRYVVKKKVCTLVLIKPLRAYSIKTKIVWKNWPFLAALAGLNFHVQFSMPY